MIIPSRDLSLDFLIHYAFSMANKNFFHVHKIKQMQWLPSPGMTKLLRDGLRAFLPKLSVRSVSGTLAWMAPPKAGEDTASEPLGE